jgi:hypothetical protein
LETIRAAGASLAQSGLSARRMPAELLDFGDANTARKTSNAA